MTTRRDFIGTMAAAGACTAVPHGFAAGTGNAALPLPTDAQRRWADMELGMFFHFDIQIYRPRWNFRNDKFGNRR